MSTANGNGAAGGTTLCEGGTGGAAGSEGASVIRGQLDQLGSAQSELKAKMQWEAGRQAAIAEHRAKLEQAMADHMAASQALAEAARRISRAEVHLTLLGAYCG